MSEINWNSVEERFALLPLREQMIVLERLQRKMRESAYPDFDPAEADRLLDEMARELADLPNEAGLNAPYPIEEGVYTERQLKPRGQ